jgi:adenylate cyclase
MPQTPGLDILLRRARSASGVILFVFVLTHLLNHALVLVSLATAETGQEWFFELWRHGVGTLVLYGAFLTHVTVNLVGLYRRQSWQMPGWQIAQIALGLLIPVLLIDHIVGTRIAYGAFGVDDTYARVLYTLWVLAPDIGIQQIVVLGIAWLHGCIGLHYWLRIHAFYGRLRSWFLAIAVLVPTLAVLGFVDGGRTIEQMIADPAGREAFLAEITLPGRAEREALGTWGSYARTVYVVLLGLVVAARGARGIARLRRHQARLTYLGAGGRTIDVPLGMSILDASRSAGIPHASVCGGRGRCSTCRVQVSGGEGALSPVAPDEQKVLDRVGAGPGVRLACQAKIGADLKVSVLLPPTVTARDARSRPSYLSGREMQIAVLFADLREFTAFAESRLPYDVVFILNRYFTSMGHAIEQAGGRVDKFIGDGVMALFGVEGDFATGCRQALDAARAMGEELAKLNTALAADLKQPLRIGVGIHAGPAIVGELGYGPAVALTAIGDTVNVASRLEALTKAYQCALVVSADALQQAGIDPGPAERHEIEVRGRSQPLVIHAFDRLETLPAMIRPRSAEKRRRLGRKII